MLAGDVIWCTIQIISNGVFMNEARREVIIYSASQPRLNLLQLFVESVPNLRAAPHNSSSQAKKYFDENVVKVVGIIGDVELSNESYRPSHYEPGELLRYAQSPENTIPFAVVTSACKETVGQLAEAFPSAGYITSTAHCDTKQLMGWLYSLATVI